MQVITSSPEATFQWGEKLAKLMLAGDTICLSGDLGAGKTLLVKGIASGIGVTEAVTSPTFTLLQIYETGRIPIHHFDLYRLEDSAQLFDIGFEEYVGTDNITLIEWANQFVTEMPEACLWIEIKKGASDEERILTMTPQGARYQALCVGVE